MKRILSLCVIFLLCKNCAAQNVGIGINIPAPAYKLHLHSASSTDVSIGITNGLTTAANLRGIRLRAIDNDFIIANQEPTGTIVLATGSNERFTLLPSGNIGLGTSSPHANALLEMNTTNKGLLLPRVSDTNAITGSKPFGLLIYSTSDNKLYCYQGTKWFGLAAANGSGTYWDLQGNAGTSEAANFIGTTDNIPLNFRVNNQRAAHISGTGGSTFTAFGYQALGLSEQDGNSAFGHQAMFNNTLGKFNTSNGYRALFSSTSGNYNTANGINTLYNNTSGHYNTAAGASALGSNTTGNDNTANGRAALAGNTTGYSNVAIGTSALAGNTVGHNLVAVGDSALFNQGVDGSGAFGTTAIGSKSLFNNSQGNANTATGAFSLFANSIGLRNTANGFSTLAKNESGNDNTAMGVGALDRSFSGSSNTATGVNSLKNNFTGNFNTASGFSAIAFSEVGSFNTALGAFANTGTDVISISNATAIGANAYVSANNALVLGSVNGINGATSDVSVGIGVTAPAAKLHIKHNSFPTASLLIEETEDDYTRVEFRNTNANSFWQINAKPQPAAGNAQLEFWNSSAGATTTPLIIKGNGNATLAGILTQLSDARLKKDIVPVKNALQKIEQLNGYTYYWKDASADNSLQTGVLAQELKMVLPELVKQDDKGLLSVNYSGIIPVLIEAIKEQQKIIAALQKQMTDLQNR